MRGFQKLGAVLWCLRTVTCVALLCPANIFGHNTSQILARADQLAWRGNWVEAGLLYKQAEQEPERSEDKKGA